MFFQGFLAELALASLAFALPASYVMVYQWGEKNGAKKMIPKIIETRSKLGLVYNVNEIRQMRQKSKDDRIFNTVEEYRNGAA